MSSNLTCSSLWRKNLISSEVQSNGVAVRNAEYCGRHRIHVWRSPVKYIRRLVHNWKAQVMGREPLEQPPNGIAPGRVPRHQGRPRYAMMPLILHDAEVHRLRNDRTRESKGAYS